MQRTQIDLLKGGIFKTMLSLAVPFLISNIFQQLYNTVDIIIVGHYLGEVSLAAIGASAPIYNLLVGFALGIGSGMSIVSARIYGARDGEMLKKSVAGTLVIGAIVTLILTITSSFVLVPILKLLGTPPEILDEAYSYIKVITLFLGVMLAYNICSSILRAIGNSIMPLVFLAISSLLNIGLDLLFIQHLQMGIKGAAIATVIAQALSTLLCLIYIFKKCEFLVPSKKHFKVNKVLYIDLASQGISMGLMAALVNIGSLILQYAINTMGYLIIAGHMAARTLVSFTIMPLNAVSSSLLTFVAQNKGANQRLRIIKAVRYANRISMLWSVCITVIIFFTAPFMLKLLTGSEDGTIINYGVTFIRITTPFYLVLGPLFNLRYTLQGMGKKVVPLVSSTMELVGKVIFTFWIFPFTGPMGVILTEPVIWCLMLIQLAVAYYKDPYIRLGGD